MAFEFLLAIAVAALVSAGACRLVIAAGVRDEPDLHRKMHKTATPTCGGIGAAAGFALALATLMLPFALNWSAALTPDQSLRMALGAGAAFLFLGIGLLDDLRPLDARGKMTVFVIAAILAPLLIGAPRAIPIGDGLVIPLHPVFGVLGAALWVFVAMNAVNFLDGANGLSMGSTAIGLVGLAIVSLGADAPHAAALSLCGAGALAGLLLWNFPLGRLFAGDAGALFAGALAAVAALIAIEDGGVSPFTAVIMFLPLLADALLTLAWRVGKRPNLLDGHRDHIFQIGLRAGVPHARITLAYWAATALCVVLGVVGAELSDGRWRAPQAPPNWTDTVASYLPFAAFAAMAGVSLVISAKVRAYARAHGHDTP